MNSRLIPDPLNALRQKNQLLRDLLAAWLENRKLSPARRRELRYHTRRVIGAQKPLRRFKPKFVHETPEERAKRLHAGKRGQQRIRGLDGDQI